MKGSLLIPRISIRDYSPRTVGEDDLEKKKDLRDRILSKIEGPADVANRCRGKLLSLDIIFYLCARKELGSPKELDNMLKILCDTFPEYVDQARTEHGLGLIEGENDHAIYEIHCIKELVKDDTEEGIDIDVFEWVRI